LEIIMDERTEARSGAEVVVGTDGSATALRAVAWAATEARLRGLVLRIVHVAPYADTTDARRHATGILGRALAAAHKQERQATVTTALLGGDPAETLVQTSRGADLLVVGMIGDHAADVLVSSVATPVAAKADCPVTVVRGPHRVDTDSLPIMLAVADPAVDGAAVEFAFADADRRGATLVVLHVAPEPRGTSATAEALETRLQPWKNRYPTVPVEIRVEHGPVVQAVLGGAIRARMVVAGSRGRGAITGALLGSTSRALVRLSVCPVTIVPRSLTAAEVVGPTSTTEAAR
jgi:nucleotide-binding universal stress UspA family protein